MSAIGTCPVCGGAIEMRLAKGRKSGKPSLSLSCPADARHFRGFINDRRYVENVLSNYGETHGSNNEQGNRQ